MAEKVQDVQHREHMRCLSLAGKGAMVTELIRTEQVLSAAAMRRQINLEDQPTSGLEIEMSKFIF